MSFLLLSAIVFGAAFLGSSAAEWRAMRRASKERTARLTRFMTSLDTDDWDDVTPPSRRVPAIRPPAFRRWN